MIGQAHSLHWLQDLKRVLPWGHREVSMQEAKGHGGLLPACDESLAVQITLHRTEQCGACGSALQVKVAESRRALRWLSF